MAEIITDINELLSREAALSSQQLGLGLTTIRKYNFASKGIFYSGIFSVSIGLERILKLIILLDYYIENGKYPENNYLKKKGHKIDKLIKECTIIKNKINNTNNIGVTSDPIVEKIISFLTEFAISSRYYNLDVATGKKPSKNEPLAYWDSEICSLIFEKHPPSQKKLSKYMEMAEKINDISIVNHTLDNGIQINDAYSLFGESAFIEEKQGYSVYYLYKIVDFSVQLLRMLDYKLAYQLYLCEHFLNLAMPNPTSTAIRKRKVWTNI